MPPQRLDSFTRAYIEAALWSTTDNSDEQGGEPLDANYGIDDIAPETMELMIEDCADFQERYAELLSESGIDDARAGHDFWLSRGGAGSGFFDEDTIDEEFQDPLQEAAKSYGEFDLYLGDPDADGEVFIHGPPPDWYRSHRKPAPAVSEARRPMIRSRLEARSASIKARFIDRKRLGEMMSPWGGDGDGGIGPVGSYYYGGHVYPDPKWVEGAIAQAESYIPKAERGEHGWTKKDERDLRTIVAGLRYYLEHDYPAGSASPRAGEVRSPPRPRYAGEADLPTTNINWRDIPRGSKVELVGHSYVVTKPDGTRASVYWSGHDAAVAQRTLDSMAQAGARGQRVPLPMPRGFHGALRPGQKRRR